MQYIQIVMWFLVGLLVLVSMRKENKIFYLAGGYFIVLGIWSLLDLLLPEADLFGGAPGVAVKAVSGIIFLVLFVFFIYHYRRNLRQNKQEAEAGEAPFSEKAEEDGRPETGKDVPARKPLEKNGREGGK